MSKSKLSLEDSITLAQNNAIDFTHACVTIALNEKFGIGKERQKKVNAVRDEVNGKVLEIMTRPASRKHEPLRKAEAWMHSQMPEGTVWELRTRQVRNEVRRMCAPKALPLAPAEVEKRIQTALQYGTPDSWQRRRTR